MVNESESNASLAMDRGLPLGNSEDIDGRRAIHVKIKNKLTEAITILVPGVATEATLIQVRDRLVDISGYVNELEALTSQLVTINTAISGSVDGLEALNTAILAAVDQLESMLTTLNNSVDGVEALITATNTALTSILNAVDQLEGYTDGVEALLTSIRYGAPTFRIAALGVAVGNGKSMLSVMNAVGSGVKFKLQGLYIYNTQISVVSGVLDEFQLRFMTGHSAGTELTTTPAASGRIRAHDTTDVLNSLVTARTGATLTAEESFALQRLLWSSDELGVTTVNNEAVEHSLGQLIAAFAPQPNTKPITINAGEGLTIRQNINSTVGVFDLVAVFTQEVAGA